MIFLPNIFERYTAALRNFIHFSAMKKGVNRHHMRLLKKIYQAEALYNYNEILPIDIYRYSVSVLDSALILSSRHKNYYYDIDFTGSFLINKRLYTALLLLLFSKNISFKAYTCQNRLIIRTDTAIPKRFKKIIFAMNGLILTSTLSKNQIIMLSASRTSKKPIYTESEFELLANPFSPIHIFLEEL